MEVEWDEPTVEHIARHGVAPEEVEEALGDPRRVGMPAYGVAGERRRTLIGVTEARRVLFVVYARRGHRLHVVTARDANAREKRRYRRR